MKSAWMNKPRQRVTLAGCCLLSTILWLAYHPSLSTQKQRHPEFEPRCTNSDLALPHCRNPPHCPSRKCAAPVQCPAGATSLVRWTAGGCRGCFQCVPSQPPDAALPSQPSPDQSDMIGPARSSLEAIWLVLGDCSSPVALLEPPAWPCASAVRLVRAAVQHPRLCTVRQLHLFSSKMHLLEFAQVVILAELAVHQCSSVSVQITSCHPQPTAPNCRTELQHTAASTGHTTVGVLATGRYRPLAPTASTTFEQLELREGGAALYGTAATRSASSHITAGPSMHSAAVLFTGGATVGGHITEAKQMAWLALVAGLQPSAILLEEKAANTKQNAELSAALLSTTLTQVEAAQIFIVSKQDHLAWGLRWFKQPSLRVFGSATGVGPEVNTDDILGQMRQYVAAFERVDAYKAHVDRVKWRIGLLEQGKRGID